MERRLTLLVTVYICVYKNMDKYTPLEKSTPTGKIHKYVNFENSIGPVPISFLDQMFFFIF